MGGYPGQMGGYQPQGGYPPQGGFSGGYGAPGYAPPPTSGNSEFSQFQILISLIVTFLSHLQAFQEFPPKSSECSML